MPPVPAAYVPPVAVLCSHCYCRLDRPIRAAWPMPRVAPCARRCDCHGPDRSTRAAVLAASAADAARIQLRRERRAGGPRLSVVSG